MVVREENNTIKPKQNKQRRRKVANVRETETETETETEREEGGGCSTRGRERGSIIRSTHSRTS